MARARQASTAAPRGAGVPPRPPIPLAGTALLCAAAVVSRAAAPVVDQLFPVFVAPGSTNALELVGNAAPWPPAFHADHPGIAFLPGTNAAAARLAVAPGVPPGPHALQFSNADGAAAPRFVVVSTDPAAAEAEPNDHFERAQAVDSLPARIDGRLAKSGDVDCFAVKLRAGRTLVARVQAHVLMSPVDAAIRLVDARGVEVAFNHDDGRTLDPLLAWTAASDGTYVVQVFGFPHPANSDVQFAGNAKCVYRLLLSDGPWPTHAVPLAVQRGAAGKPVLHGWNLPSPAPAVDADATRAQGDTFAVAFPGAPEPLVLPLADEPQLAEREPDDARGEAQPLPFPGAVTGSLATRGDVDRYAVALPASPVEFVLRGASLGFPVDARLRVEDAAGAVAARADEGAVGDPVLSWTPPRAGTYQVVVDALVHRDDPRQFYHLAVRAPRPALEFALAEASSVLEAGKTNELKVTAARRNGHTNAVSLRVEGLPAGVTAAKAEIAATAAEGTLRLVASTNAPASGVPLRVVASVAGADVAVGFPLASGGENNGVPQGFKDVLLPRVPWHWLTVKAAPAPTNAPPAKSP